MKFKSKVISIATTLIVLSSVNNTFALDLIEGSKDTSYKASGDVVLIKYTTTHPIALDAFDAKINFNPYDVIKSVSYIDYEHSNKLINKDITNIEDLISLYKLPDDCKVTATIYRDGKIQNLYTTIYNLRNIKWDNEHTVYQPITMYNTETKKATTVAHYPFSKSFISNINVTNVELKENYRNTKSLGSVTLMVDNQLEISIDDSSSIKLFSKDDLEKDKYYLLVEDIETKNIQYYEVSNYKFDKNDKIISSLSKYKVFELKDKFLNSSLPKDYRSISFRGAPVIRNGKIENYISCSCLFKNKVLLICEPSL